MTVKQNAIVSLKYPAFLDGVGNFKVLEAETVSTGSGRFQAKVLRVQIKGRWLDAKGKLIWLHENSVVGRSYVTPLATQASLIFPGAVKSRSRGVLSGALFTS
jgi:hypothetical protein